jgi:hypothetical protein
MCDVMLYYHSMPPEIMLAIHVNQGLSCLQFPLDEFLVYRGLRCVSEVSLEFGFFLMRREAKYGGEKL